MATEKVNMRLLAAIMFADMVGYTRLMQENEENAVELRDRQRSVLEACILSHHGQVMQYYGDGTLTMFGSAIEAVKCAREIQLILNAEPKVPVRIGIHVGDVVYDDEGIYGDAVNLAARVQALGVPGGVMISEKVFDEVKNQPGIRVEAFGKHKLKNVFDPVGIYALADDGLEIPSQEQLSKQTGSNENSIAVLPFVNMSSDPENEFFSDGITEEIINALAKVEGLNISARTSVFAYKGKQTDIRTIGQELNVSRVLEGSVRRAGDRVRITAQLIKTEDGFHEWSEVYDREMKDIFGVQDEISRIIAMKLEDDFIDRKDQVLYEASTDSIDAYTLYLKGLYHWNKWTPEDVFKAMEFYEKAIKKCKTYTKAYSGLAACYNFLATIGYLNAEEAYPKAQEYAVKSIELNDKISDPYTALGYVDLFYNWDYKRAEANFRKAITLEPEAVMARQGLGMTYRIIGRFDKMVQQYEMAQRIEPINPNVNFTLAIAYWVIGKPNKALKVLDRIIELDPDYRAAHEFKSLVCITINKIDLALEEIEIYERLLKESNTSIDTEYGAITPRAYLAAVTGDNKLASSLLNLLQTRQDENPKLNLSMDFAMVYSALNDFDKAFEYINQAIDEKLGAILLFTSIIPFNVLRTDPRYDEVITRLKLPTQSLIAQ